LNIWGVASEKSFLRIYCLKGLFKIRKTSCYELAGSKRNAFFKNLSLCFSQIFCKRLIAANWSFYVDLYMPVHRCLSQCQVVMYYSLTVAHFSYKIRSLVWFSGLFIT